VEEFALRLPACQIRLITSTQQAFRRFVHTGMSLEPDPLPTATQETKGLVKVLFGSLWGSIGLSGWQS